MSYLIIRRKLFRSFKFSEELNFYSSYSLWGKNLYFLQLPQMLILQSSRDEENICGLGPTIQTESNSLLCYF